jgi:hypothetical protein
MVRQLPRPQPTAPHAGGYDRSLVNLCLARCLPADQRAVRGLLNRYALACSCVAAGVMPERYAALRDATAARLRAFAGTGCLSTGRVRR